MNFEPFVLIIEYLISIIITLIKTWWWLFLPLIVYFPAKALYLWWVWWEVWYKSLKWVILEIIPPAEVLKPYEAMEDVFNRLWPIYDGANWREMWCEGEFPNGPFWFSFEVISIEGRIHFLARCLKEHQKLIETAFHTHYPDAEIYEFGEDYTQKVPQDIPNKDYDLYGEDSVLMREDAYPIETYKFFEIKPGEIYEEKKLDPFSSLMESMCKLGPGEQYWVQIVVDPILDSDVPWITEGDKLVEKLARRPGPAAQKSLFQEIGDAILGTGEEKEEVRELIPPEMKLTPGEREALAAVENKISQVGFRTNIRSLYIYKRDARVGPHGKIWRGYQAHFVGKNSLFYLWRTRTRIHYFFRQRRLYKRKRQIFEKYVKRFPPLYPKRTGWGRDGLMILNGEELATLFHLPSKAALLPPGVPRVLAKKRPPVTLPTE